MTLRTIATPLTIGSFIAVCFTGLCLLFGYRAGLINPVHEASSILFVAGSVLHIVINLKPTMAHLRRPLGAGIAACFVIVSALAILPLGDQQGDPRKVLGQATEVILDSNLQGVAALTRQSEQELMGILAQAGFGTRDPSTTLRELARSNSKSSMDILAVVLPGTARPD